MVDTNPRMEFKKRYTLGALFVMLGLVGLMSKSVAAQANLAEALLTDDQSMIESTIDLPETLTDATDPNDVYRAKVVVIINKSNVGSTAQVMRVYVDGVATADATGQMDWKVSTGREKVETAKNGDVYKTSTPVGYFRPRVLVKLHKSKKWQADMPHAVFFNGGIATHATTLVKDLGKRASGGCVRLSPENAKKLFALVKDAGVSEVTQIARDGKDVLKKDGTPVKIKAYNTLIIVENKI